MILEYVQTKLKSSVEKTTFIVKAKTVNEKFLSKQPGFIEHTSWWTEDEKWVDTVKWESLALAKAASEKAMQNELCLSWFAMMDENATKMGHYTEAVTY